jgi:hypothetical protein
MGRLNTFVAGVLTGLAAAAVSQEMQKSPEERTWKGKIAGVPYNFQLGEWRNIASEYWNPESDKILTPRVIGMGWGVNFAALARRVQEWTETQQQQREQRRIPEPVER